MRKCIIKIFMLIISFYTINVFAATNANEGSSEYSSLKSSYDRGTITYNVSSSDTVILYGKANCSGNSCSLQYAASSNNNVEDALAKSVICTNGETKISYTQSASGKDAYDSTKTTNINYSGIGYYSEDYEVKCDSEGAVTLSNNSTSTTGTSSGSSSGSSSSSSGSSSGSSSSSSESSSSSSGSYNSGSTVDNESTGVNTYFVVLGITALISYVFMLLVKRFNLFKKI